jgi:hypothetical protein
MMHEKRTNFKLACCAWPLATNKDNKPTLIKEEITLGIFIYLLFADETFEFGTIESLAVPKPFLCFCLVKAADNNRSLSDCGEDI